MSADPNTSSPNTSNPEEPGRKKSSRKELSREEQYQKLMDYALAALSQRSLTEAELRQKLLRRDPEEQFLESVLARLEVLGYLNDAEVARSEAQRRGVGGYRVRQRLRRRGIDDELIEEALEGRDPERELQEARDLLRGRMNALLSGKNARQRAYGFLARRGYDSGIVSQVVGEQEWPIDERPERKTSSWGRRL